jgi:hypothetical protein
MVAQLIEPRPGHKGTIVIMTEDLVTEIELTHEEVTGLRHAFDYFEPHMDDVVRSNEINMLREDVMKAKPDSTIQYLLHEYIMESLHQGEPVNLVDFWDYVDAMGDNLKDAAMAHHRFRRGDITYEEYVKGLLERKDDKS